MAIYNGKLITKEKGVKVVVLSKKYEQTYSDTSTIVGARTHGTR
jgi:hypothetical protein